MREEGIEKKVTLEKEERKKKEEKEKKRRRKRKEARKEGRREVAKEKKKISQEKNIAFVQGCFTARNTYQARDSRYL